jgi:hypothetical protein
MKMMMAKMKSMKVVPVEEGKGVGGRVAGGGRLAGRRCFQGLGFGRWLL